MFPATGPGRLVVAGLIELELELVRQDDNDVKRFVLHCMLFGTRSALGGTGAPKPGWCGQLLDAALALEGGRRPGREHVRALFSVPQHLRTASQHGTQCMGIHQKNDAVRGVR